MPLQFTMADINMVLKVSKIPAVNILAEHYRPYSTVATIFGDTKSNCGWKESKQRRVIEILKHNDTEDCQPPDKKARRGN